MADAKRCTKCKKFYDLNDITGEACRFYNPVFITSESYRKGTIDHHLIDDEYSDTSVDLCPACTKKFKEFMANDEVPDLHRDIKGGFIDLFDILAGSDTDGD